MKRDSLDEYDVLPESMINYLSNYGRHFNKKLLKFAVSLINHDDEDDKEFEPISKLDADKLLTDNNIKLKHNQLYDYLYVANMCKADFLYRSVPDEKHMAMYIKDVIDDKDGYDGIVFNRWYADTRRKGIPIDWDAML